MIKYVARKRTVAIVQGDDLDRIEDRMQQLQSEGRRSEAMGSARIGDDDDLAVLGEEFERELEVAAENAIAVDVSPLPAGRWYELLRAYPPREDNEDDERSGFHAEAFPIALLAESAEVDDLNTPTARKEFFKSLPAGELTHLFEVAWKLNTGASPDPKALRSLLPSRSSIET